MESVQWALVHCGGGWDGGQLQTHEHQDGGRGGGGNWGKRITRVRGS